MIREGKRCFVYCGDDRCDCEADDTNVIVFPKPQPKPDDCGPICAPCDVEPTDDGAA